MIVKIRKTSDNRNSQVDGAGFRDGQMGYIAYPPEIGEGITLFTCKDRDSMMLMTTVVKEITHEPSKWLVKTLNSTYEVEKVSD